jgi:hypothetical protein
MKFLFLLLLAQNAFATYSPQTIITGGTTGNTAEVTGSQELRTFINTDSNIAKETGGNLASILSQLEAGIPVTVPNPLPVSQYTSPWTISGNVNSAQSGVWNVGRTWTLSSGTDSVDVGNFPSTYPVTGTFWQSIQPVSGTISVGNTVAISAASLPLPTGAATNSELVTINSTLGSPFQAGGSIGNTSFGISGLLPAFASTPTFNLGTLNGAATNAELVTINSTLGSPMQNSGGSVTANLGTLNGAATNAELVTINSTLGSPMQNSGGSVTANLGTLNGAATAANQTNGTQQTEINNGSNVAAVKAGSTTAVASDPALVVAISPNNTPVLPNGAATNSELVTINSTLGSPMQNSGGSVTANLGTLNGAATAANQTTGNSTLTTINTTLGSPFQAGGSIGNTAFALNAGSSAIGYTTGRGVLSTFIQSYSSSNLSTSAFTTIISSTSATINEIGIFDKSGGMYYLAYASACGSLSTSSNAIIINPGGGSFDFQIPSGNCVGFEAIGSAITSNNAYMTFYK